MAQPPSVTLRHDKIELALHTVREGALGHALLLLHGLGERSESHLASAHVGWPGPVFALDFTGHGASTPSCGGGYTAELMMGDADAALAHLGTATLCGRGLGAYVALLLCGARPEQALGAILCDGPGIAGGGSSPATPAIGVPAEPTSRPPDPFALLELSRDLRPPSYAADFARQATQFSPLDRPVSVCCRERPEWLVAVLDEPGVEETSTAEAIAHYAAKV